MPVIIDKLYGPAVADRLRVTWKADFWVIEIERDYGWQETARIEGTK